MDSRNITQPTEFTINRMRTPNIWAFVLAIGAFTFLGVFYFVHGIMNGDPRWMAIPAACVMASYVTFERKRVHDQSLLISRTVTNPLPPEESHNIQPDIQPIILNENTARLGRFKFSPSEWARLSAILSANDWRFTRDIVSQAGIFTNITKNWREIYADFERMGFVENYSITSTGREWFAQLLPLPHPNGRA